MSCGYIGDKLSVEMLLTALMLCSDSISLFPCSYPSHAIVDQDAVWFSGSFLALVIDGTPYTHESCDSCLFNDRVCVTQACFKL